MSLSVGISLSILLFCYFVIEVILLVNVNLHETIVFLDFYISHLISHPIDLVATQGSSSSLQPHSRSHSCQHHIHTYIHTCSSIHILMPRYWRLLHTIRRSDEHATATATATATTTTILALTLISQTSAESL